MSTETEQTTKKVCPRCGKKNDPDRKYCQYCSWDMDLKIYPDD